MVLKMHLSNKIFLSNDSDIAIILSNYIILLNVDSSYMSKNGLCDTNSVAASSTGSTISEKKSAAREQNHWCHTLPNKYFIARVTFYIISPSYSLTLRFGAGVRLTGAVLNGCCFVSCRFDDPEGPTAESEEFLPNGDGKKPTRFTDVSVILHVCV